MQAVVDLGVDRSVDCGVAVSGGVHGDSCVEVEEAVAVDVFDDDSRTSADDERVDPRERRAAEALVLFDDPSGARPGQLGTDLRSGEPSEFGSVERNGGRDW